MAEGTYYENINFGGKNIVLRTIDPNDHAVVAATIIDGNDVNSVVTFAGTESSSCVLSGFTITNGQVISGSGAGINGNGTMATIENNIINGNKQVVQLDRIEKNHLAHIETTGKRAVELLGKMDDKLDDIKLMNQRIFDKLDK